MADTPAVGNRAALAPGRQGEDTETGVPPAVDAAGSAVAAAVLLTGVAGYQVAVAAGAPLGGHVWGGRYESVLPPRMRAASGVGAVVLMGVALVVLVAAGSVRVRFLERRAARRASAVLAAYFALNTAGNLASRSVVERVMMGSITAVLTVLLARVARSSHGGS